MGRESITSSAREPAAGCFGVLARGTPTRFAAGPILNEVVGNDRADCVLQGMGQARRLESHRYYHRSGQ